MTSASDHGLLGRSAEIESLRRLIDKASRNRLPVLLLGESGTGKEVVA
jgi:sigma-54 specific flagellar transcriptional regulator A